MSNEGENLMNGSTSAFEPDPATEAHQLAGNSDIPSAEPRSDQVAASDVDASDVGCFADDDDNNNVDDDDDEDSDESEDDPVETLVRGRDRRTTQGNRYSALLQQETAGEDGDDELALLCAEAEEEDVDFEDPDAEQSDVAAEDEEDSSTDDEDPGPAAGDDELEGEAQLKKEERAVKLAQKRKAERALVKPPPASRKKRVKIDESATASDAPSSAPSDKKRKMSERISWVPTGSAARASSRTLSVQNKERTMENMKESESRRRRQIAVMQAAQRRREAKKKPMTQAERMAEAAETERLNTQSLSRWEEFEKEREKKQIARLEAMQNRKIEGPFIRFHSARAEWADGKLQQLGNNTVTVLIEDKPATGGEVKKRVWTKRSKIQQIAPSEKDATPAASTEPMSEVGTKPSTPARGVHPNGNRETSMPAPRDQSSTAVFDDNQESESISNSMKEEPGSDKIYEEQKTTNDANNDVDEGDPEDLANGNERSINTPAGNDQYEAPSSDEGRDEDQMTTEFETQPEVTSPPEQQGDSKINHNGHSLDKSRDENQPQGTDNDSPHVDNSTQDESAQANANAINQPPGSSSIPIASTNKCTEVSTRNTIALVNFDAAAVQDATVLRYAAMGTPLPPNYVPPAPSSRANARVHYPPPPPKPDQPVCAVTGQPAKYRDPVTGLAYANAAAYKAIHRLADGTGSGGAVWSSLLGVWVGAGAANGVPQGFSGAVAPGTSSVQPEPTAPQDAVKIESV